VKNPPLEPPITVTTKEALRLLGVSRSRFHEWRTAGLISVYCYNGNRLLYLRADVVAVLDRLPRGSKPTPPLLSPEDQALARERAGEPDFAGIFAEHFQRLVPSLGEDEAWRRALANTIRVYSVHYGCAYKPASAAVRALIPPKAPPALPESVRDPETDSIGQLLFEQQTPAIELESEPPGADQRQSSCEPGTLAPDLAAVYAERFKLTVGNLGPDEARLRAFEHAIGVCRTHYRVDLETAKRMVSDAIKAARAKKLD
jgi:hypothetical protein